METELLTGGLGGKGYIKPESKHALELPQLLHVYTIWEERRRRRERERKSCPLAHIKLWAKAAEV